jgi:ParB family transcriptional regulator, chromosome partitioning protein
VHRGLLREEQAKALRAREREEAGAAGEAADAESSPKSRISEKLAKRLSAHRTAALQAEVARHPHVALVALVHRLALSVVVEGYYTGGSPVNVTAVPQRGLETHAPDIAQSPALVGMLEVRQAWAARLPEDPDALFAELLALPQQELLSLLAVCVAETVDALSSSDSDMPGAALARAVGLDMHDWWTPTAAGYFEHVAKARVLEAVQGFAPDHLKRLEKVKKAELASEAERLVAGTGWLPPTFCHGAPNDAGQTKQKVEMHSHRAEDEVPDDALAAS